MVSPQGQIQYFIRVTVRSNNEKEEPKKLVKGIIVQAPMVKDLMVC